MPSKDGPFTARDFKLVAEQLKCSMIDSSEIQMINLPSLLTPIDTKLDDLLLDPNNPRFSELGEQLNPVPEGRFADEKVQASTLDKMKTPLFDVAELRDTIKTIGFLPMDRIVVRKWKGQPLDGRSRYVVIEGNRRG